MRKQTYHEGANDERGAWLKTLRARRRRFGDAFTESVLLDALIAWGLDRDKRYGKKVGGLGPKV